MNSNRIRGDGRIHYITRKAVSMLLSVCLTATLATTPASAADTDSVSLGAPQYSGSTFTLPNAAATGTYANASTLTVSVTNGQVASDGLVGWTYYTDANTTHTAYMIVKNNGSTTSVAAVLGSLTFKPNDGISSGDMKISVSLDSNTTNLPAGATITAGTGTNAGHYYMYVPSDQITWINAYNGAKACTFIGMKGYLATITNATENAVLHAISSTSAWGGGTRLKMAGAYLNDGDSLSLGSCNTDDASDSDYWYWADGPEAGAEFFTQKTSAGGGTPYNGAYNSWTTNASGGEPNDSTNEQSLQLNNNYQGGNSTWNDLAYNSTSVVGYFVEFGGYASGSANGFTSDYSTAKTYTQTFTVLSSPSTSLNGLTGISSLTIPAASGVSYGILDVSGKAVTSGATITDGTGSPLSFDANGWFSTANSPITVTGLAPGNMYTVVADGNSDMTTDKPDNFTDTTGLINNSVKITVPAVSAKTPTSTAPIGNVNATLGADGKVTVTIDPANANVQYNLLDGSGNALSGIDWTSPINGKVVFSGLAADTSYKVAVRPLGSKGDATDVADCKTPASTFVNVSSGDLTCSDTSTLVISNTVSGQSYGIVDPITGEVVASQTSASNGSALTFSGLDFSKGYKVVTWGNGALPGKAVDVPVPVDPSNLYSTVVLSGKNAGQGEIELLGTDKSLTYVITDASGKVVSVQPGVADNGISYEAPLTIGSAYYVSTVSSSATNIPKVGDKPTDFSGFSAKTEIDVPVAAPGNSAYLQQSSTAGKYDIVINPALDSVKYVLTDSNGNIVMSKTASNGKVIFEACDSDATYKIYDVPADSTDALTTGSSITAATDASLGTTVETIKSGVAPVDAGNLTATTNSITIKSTDSHLRYNLIDPVTGLPVGSWVTKDGSSQDTSITFTGLPAGKVYRVAVMSVSNDTDKGLPMITAYYTMNPYSGGSVNPLPGDVTINSGTGTGTGTSNSAKIPFGDTDSSTVSNVIVNLPTVTVTAPSSVLRAALGTNSSAWLEISQQDPDSSTQAAVTAIAAQNNALTVQSLDVNLTQHNSDGTSTAIHQLSDSITVTIKLTAAQLAKITDASSAKLYYYDTGTKAFTDMFGTFDLTKGTVSFKSKHFSTFVITCSNSSPTVGVSYRTHVKTFGWLTSVTDGAQSGTTGKALRAEAVELSLTGSVPSGASILYQAYVQGKGWLSPVSSGSIAGTTGEKRQMDAIRISLQGLTGYEVQYRVHVQTSGWLSWQTTKNGTTLSSAAIAGTTDNSIRVESIEVRIVKVGS